MKKFKTGLVALALVLGVSGAFVSKIHAAPKAFEQTFDWDGSGPGLTGQDLDKTIDEAKADYGCSGMTVQCASSVVHGTSTPGPNIFQN